MQITKILKANSILIAFLSASLLAISVLPANYIVPELKVEAATKSRHIRKTRRKAKQKKRVKYSEAKITLPAGYTNDELTKAYDNKPSAEFIKACMSGVKNNTFKHSESAHDDKTKVDPTKLTESQKDEIVTYTLRLINGTRNCLNLKPWIKSSGSQNIADDIAIEYAKNKKSVFDEGGHYVEGIVRACHKNGLNIDDNYIEDMTGFSYDSKLMTITELKSEIYDGLIIMLFGYNGGNYNSVKSYDEWHHAGDLLSNSGTRLLGTNNADNPQYDDYFGLSISRIKDEYSIHYIHVSSYYFTGFKQERLNSTFKP